MTITLMWEARAVPGKGEELLNWARSQPLERAPLRRETFSASGDRVLVLTWWEAAGSADELAEPSDLPELPEPPADLLTRAVHRWRFTSHGLG